MLFGVAKAALAANIVLVLSFLTSGLGGDVLMEPEKTGQPQVVVVFIQGAEIPAERYVPLATELQIIAPLSLWVGIPDFPLSTPEPLVISGGIQRVLNSLYAKGLERNAPLFVAAHSLGGVIVQDWTANPGNGTKVEGQILLGSYVLRKWRNQTAGYPVTTLTVGGELDGLSRISRMAEAYYHSILHPKQPSTDFPVVVLPGVSHMQFASGAPPTLVKDRDLKPEVTYDEAHRSIATVMSDYMLSRLQGGGGEAAKSLVEMVEKTSNLVMPLIDALEMEGFYHFKPPCYDNPPSDMCTYGNQWSEYAQTIMGGLDNTTHLIVTDAFHPVYQINPIHLPHTFNNCTQPAGCVLNVTTVTQNVYSTGDSLDTAFVPIAATTMRVKMESRQKIWTQAGKTPAEFNTTDAPSICAMINRESLAWASTRAGANTLDRFKEYGEPLEMGDDLGPYNAGPLWIWNDLHYDEKKPGPVMVVRSPMMKTPTNYWEHTAAGFHYCKLLSPARSMEWIYVDGLRAHYSISNSSLI